MERRERAAEIEKRHVELLHEENAFVDVSDALRRKRARTGGSVTQAVDDDEDEFLGGLRLSSRWASRQSQKQILVGKSASFATASSSSDLSVPSASLRSRDVSSPFPKRITNLNKVLADQHQRFLQKLSGSLEVDGAGTDRSQFSVGSSGSLRSCEWIAGRTPPSPLFALKDLSAAAVAVASQKAVVHQWMQCQEAIDRGDFTAMSPLMAPSHLSILASSADVLSTSNSKHRTLHGNRLCSVCLRPHALYTCVRCGVARYCSVDCHDIHDETRCLKWVM